MLFNSEPTEVRDRPAPFLSTRLPYQAIIPPGWIATEGTADDGQQLDNFATGAGQAIVVRFIASANPRLFERVALSVSALRPTLGLLLLAALVAACATPDSGSSVAEPSPSVSATVAESASATISESPSATAAASDCSGDVLVVDCFARLTADSVRVRTGAGLDAPPLVLPPPGDGLPYEARVGLSSGYEHVFVVDGPVRADGVAWYQVAVMNTEFEQSVAPLFVGWVASGDGTDTWLVPEDPCPPAGPVELADLTYAKFDTPWAIYVGCFRDQVFTLRGWFPLLHPEFEIPYDVDGSCFAQPAFLVCGASNKDIRTIEMSYIDPRQTERLNFTVDPAAGVELPARGQWIEIIGGFDHPASQQCGPDPGNILACRAVFVATDVAVSE